MKHNKYFDDFVAEISDIQPDFTKYAKQFLRYKQRPKTFANYQYHFHRLYVKDCIKKSKFHVKFNPTDLVPINHIEHTWGSKLFIKQQGQKIARYDHVIAINDFPFILDFTLRDWDTKPRLRKMFSDYEDRLTPIERLLEKEVGYGIMIASDVHEDHIINKWGSFYARAKNAYDFHRNNGYILKSGIKREEFNTELHGIIAQYALPLIQNSQD